MTIKKRRLPYYPWFPHDYATAEDVTEMSRDEDLLYRRALDVAWMCNGLPNAEEMIALEVKYPPDVFRACWATVRKHFVVHGKRLVNLRQEDLRKNAKSIRESYSNRGKQGADERKRRNEGVSSASSPATSSVTSLAQAGASLSLSLSPSTSLSTSLKGKEGGVGEGKPDPRAVAERLVAIWNEGRSGRPIDTTGKRVEKTKARLSDGFTEAELETVVRKIKISPWHTGNNLSGWKAPGPEWALSSHEKVEDWLNREKPNARTQAGPAKSNPRYYEQAAADAEYFTQLDIKHGITKSDA